MTLGQRLHHLRRVRKMSQADLARGLGAQYTQQCVSAWECDHRQMPLVVLPALVRLLGLDRMETFFDDTRADPQACQTRPKRVD